VNPDGTINFTGDAAHMLNAPLGGVSAQTNVAFAPGTRSEYLDEYVVGFEHEFGNSGVIFSARYQDRRIKRIVEDLAPISPEAFQSGLAQNYLIGNPSKSFDHFINPNQIGFSDPGLASFDANGNYIGAQVTGCGVPGAGDGSDVYGFPTDANGNNPTNTAGNNAFCLGNALVAGTFGADGLADGFVDPVRIYKSMEFEVNKSFSKNWQLRTNYRIAKSFGNYEGSYRNDNNQSDPNISSLFDFTQGDWNLLGQQFTPGVLNTDVRHTVNGYVSYMFGNHYMKGLTLGVGSQFHTGTPVNNLFAHPAYQNAGEMPF